MRFQGLGVIKLPHKKGLTREPVWTCRAGDWAGVQAETKRVSWDEKRKRGKKEMRGFLVVGILLFRH